MYILVLVRKSFYRLLRLHYYFDSVFIWSKLEYKEIFLYNFQEDRLSCFGDSPRDTYFIYVYRYISAKLLKMIGHASVFFYYCYYYDDYYYYCFYDYECHNHGCCNDIDFMKLAFPQNKCQ